VERQYAKFIKQDSCAYAVKVRRVAAQGFLSDCESWGVFVDEFQVERWGVRICSTSEVWCGTEVGLIWRANVSRHVCWHTFKVERQYAKFSDQDGCAYAVKV
jgi:hypothetical protein